MVAPVGPPGAFRLREAVGDDPQHVAVEAEPDVAAGHANVLVVARIAVERRLTVDQVSRVFAVFPSLTGSITDATRAMHLVNRDDDFFG